MSSRLISAVVEIDAHVAEAGWDQPARMFALAAADELAAAEPDLAAQLGVEALDEAWVPIEQEWPDDGALDEALMAIGWPSEVRGCVLVLERIVLPPSAEEELMNDGLDPQSYEFASRAAEHHERRDVRMTIGVERDGAKACRLRIRHPEGPDTFNDGPDLVPGLSRALQSTFDH
jgi:hypothetical protein